MLISLQLSTYFVSAHMHRINRLAGTNITIYHTFHSEVANYKTHVWRCDGICQHRPPYYGYVRRAMNRAPSKNDWWFAQHQVTFRSTIIQAECFRLLAMVPSERSKSPRITSPRNVRRVMGSIYKVVNF